MFHLISGILGSSSEVYCDIDGIEPRSTSTSVVYIADGSIEAGDEILTSYGTSSWFEKRDVPYDPVHVDENLSFSRPLEYLYKEGYCLSDVYVFDSLIPFAGRGLFAKRNFKEGELITVTPVLFLPENELLLTRDDSVLINYCFASTHSNIAMLPIGLAAMANHQFRELANMRYEWLNDVESLSTLTSEVIFRSVNAVADVAFYATRNIEANEELTFSYGESWMNAW